MEFTHHVGANMPVTFSCSGRRWTWGMDTPAWMEHMSVSNDPTVSNDELIAQMERHPHAVRRLRSPWQRAALWFAISLPVAAIVGGAHLVAGSGAVRFNARLAIEETAILLTAATAAIAAFSATVPGRDWRMS